MGSKPVVLMTGGSGLVGRNLLEHPRRADWHVVAPKSAELDLRSWPQTEAYLRNLRPNYVVHCAGRVGGIQANIAHPVDFLVENTDMARNLLLAARDAGVTRVLNLGSSCMYPRDAANPLTESLLLRGELEPTNEGYALAKIFAVRLCQYISREDSRFQFKTLIPCNLYGRGDKFDERHSHLVPAVIVKLHKALRDGVDSIEIWGDGTARREFMYAGDLADAVYFALGHFDALPDLMNIGCGTDRSVYDYYLAAAKAMGWGGEFKFDLSKPVGMKQKLLDVGRQTEMGWRPSTSLEDGIALTYQYYLHGA